MIMRKNVLFLGVLPIIALVSGCGSKSYKPGDELTVTSIEMKDEYGDSTLIQYNGFDILVDSGNKDDASHVNEVLNNKVTDKEIDLLVVTHPHGDHIGGLINNSLYGFNVKHIVDYGYNYVTNGDDKIDNKEYVSQYVTFRNYLISKGSTYQGIKEQIKESEIYEIDKKNDIQIRWLKNDYYFGKDETFPNDSVKSTNPNVTSVSFVLEYKYWNVLMCGDADSTYLESSLITNHKKLFNDKKKKILLKSTHHSSSSSMGGNFLDWARPNIIFTSSAMIDAICAPNPVVLGSGEGQLNHPNRSTVRRIKQNGCDFYWNAINGDITFKCDGVNDMSMSGAGRHKDYLKKDSEEIADKEKEKNVKFFDSEFAKYF